MKNLPKIFLVFYFFTPVFLSAQISFVGHIVESSGTVNPLKDGVFLNPTTYIFGTGNNWDIEPHVLTPDGINRIIDLKSGSDGSGSHSFVKYKGIVYFVASGDEGQGIYKTDGTPSGTEMAFDLSGNATEILITRNDLMYFSIDDTVYMFDGNTLTPIDYPYPLNIEYHSDYNDFEWCLSGDGIALVNRRNNQAVLLQILGTEVTELGNLLYYDSFDEYVGMEGYNGGIIFSVESFSSNIEGNYVFSISDGTYTKIGSNLSSVRTAIVNEETCIATHINSGTYIFDKNNPSGKKIFDSSPELFASKKWNVGHFQDGILYEGLSGSFEDTKMVYYDASTGINNVVHTTDDASPMVTAGGYSFYFAESELGNSFSESDLFVFNKETNTVSPIITISDRHPKDIKPIAVINNELYFWAEIEELNNYAVYKYPLNFSVATKEINNSDEFHLIAEGQKRFKVNFDKGSGFFVDVFSISGQNVFHKTSSHNELSFEINGKGIFVVKAQSGNSIKVFKIFVD